MRVTFPIATLTECRRQTQREIGPYYIGTASAGSTVTKLVDSKWPMATGLDVATLHIDEVLFLPSAATVDQTRFVLTYDPAAGALVPDTPWGTQPVNGQVYELSSVPPILDGFNDLHAYINEGLKRCMVVVEICATPIPNRRRHGLGAIAHWLANPLWVYRVGYLQQGELRSQRSPYDRAIGGEILIEGGEAVIEHGLTFQATDTLYAQILKPAFYHCRVSGGTFGDQSGLLTETDECPVPVDWVAPAALVEYYLRELETNPNSQKVQAALQRAGLRYTDKVHAYLHPPRRTFHPLRMQFGPFPSSSGTMATAFRATGF